MNLDNLDTIIGFALVILLLSLIITSVVQLVGWVLRLRERALLWGIERVLAQLAPGPEVASLAKAVAQHAAITPTGKGSATAIHFDELVKILKQVINDPKNPTWTTKYAGLLTALDTAPVKELTTLATALETELSQAFPQEVARVKEAAARAKATALQAGSQIRFWFDTVMDRTTERFVAHTRLVTVVAAVGFSFGARIDSLAILKQLSQRPDLRAQLVQMAAPVMKEAGAVLHQTPVDANSKDLLPLPAALAAIKASHPQEVPADLAGPDSTDPAAWESALAAKLPAATKDAVLADFRTALGKAEVEWLSGHVKTLQGELAQTSLQVVPGGPFTADEYKSHWLGILISAFFLSLGAPFWFNTLRQLSNLRPILAGKVDAKDAADGSTSSGSA